MFTKQKIRILTLALGVCASAMFAFPADAQVAVQGVVRSFTPGQRPIENVPVKNTSTEKILKITSEVLTATRLADGKEDAQPSADIVVAPSTFILKPGEEKVVRLMLVKPPSRENERAYRVNFRPTEPPTENKDDSAPSAIRANLGVLTSMGMYITVAPEAQAPKLTFTRDSSGITFVNEGNVSIDIKRRNNFCFDTEGKDCRRMPGRRLLPGSAWKLEIEPDKKVEYNYDVYGKGQLVVVPPL